MWELLPRKWQLTLVLATGMVTAKVIEWIALLFGLGEPSLAKSISAATFIVGTVLLFLVNLSWRPLWKQFPILARKLFPDLNGRWEGTLLSTWIDPAMGQALAPIPATITIEQTLLTTDIRLRTAESESHSVHVLLERLQTSGRFRVWCDYKNGPKAQFRHRSAPHDGVAVLEIDMQSGPDLLEGRYYTERKTTGDISVRRTSNP